MCKIWEKRGGAGTFFCTVNRKGRLYGSGRGRISYVVRPAFWKGWFQGSSQDRGGASLETSKPRVTSWVGGGRALHIQLVSIK